MTNNEIIFETVRANFTPAQLAELVAATYTAEQIAARRAGVKITVAEGSDETPDAVFHAMLAADTFHTFAEWKRMGYSVKKGQHAALVCNLWKYTDKPGKAAKEAAAYEWKWSAEQDEIALKECLARGMVINDVSDEPAWTEAARSVWPQFYDKVGGKAVVDEALAIMQQ